MDDIILVLKKRYHSDFPEYLVDFFDLCLLTLSDCLPKNLDPKIKQKLLNQVKEMESNAHGNEVESLQQLLNKLSL